MSNPQKHHYVPRSFFKPWCDDSNRVWVYEFDRDSKNIKNPYQIGTGGICYEDGLYSFNERIRQENRNELEKFFSEIDGDASKILKRLIENDNTEILSETDRQKFSIFISLMTTRTPEVFKPLKKENIKKFRYEAIKSGAYTEENFPEILDNRFHGGFAKAIQQPRMINYLMKMKWKTFDLGEIPTNFLTSDRPLISTGHHEEKNLIIYLPISPRKIFIASTENNSVYAIKNMSKLEFIQKINKITIEQAERKAFSFDKTTHNIRFFQKNLGKKYNKIMPFANNS